MDDFKAQQEEADKIKRMVAERSPKRRRLDVSFALNPPVYVGPTVLAWSAFGLNISAGRNGTWSVTLVLLVIRFGVMWTDRLHRVQKI